MKGDYNIQDRELFEALKILSEALEERNIPYFIFGGVAAQSQIASIETESGRKDIKAVDTAKFRRTGDIDMYIADENALLFFNELAAMNPQYRIVNMPGSVKIGQIRVNYVTEPSELKGFKDVVENQLEDRETVYIRKGTTSLAITVSPIEYLIAAKLSGNKVQAKDLEDITRVIDASRKAGRQINQNAVKDLLARLQSEDRYHILEQILTQEH